MLRVPQWYTRGVDRIKHHFRLEVILQRLLNHELYFREMKRLDLGTMKRIKNHREYVISLQTDEEVNDNDDGGLAGEDELKPCEDQRCHRFVCPHMREDLTIQQED